jgi:hypothetical protein
METLKYRITEDDHMKILHSKEYNYVFNKDLTTLLRWGKNKDDNPIWAPFGPEVIIVDVNNMSMELFTIIINILNTNQTINTVSLLGLANTQDGHKVQYCIESGLTPLLNINIESEEEAGLFSAYVDNKGLVKPISSYNEGIDIMGVNNFYIEIWNSNLFKKYRWEKLQQC